MQSARARSTRTHRGDGRTDEDQESLHKRSGRSATTTGSRRRFLEPRAGPRRGLWDLRRSACARRCGGNGKRRDPRRRRPERTWSRRHHAGEPRRRPPRGRARGVELEWVEGDAQALPFGDDEFDVVTSSVGAIFAPDHQAVADELLRVCRPGGTIGMIAFVAEGSREFFAVFARRRRHHHSSPPLLWGREGHVGSSSATGSHARPDPPRVRRGRGDPAGLLRLLQGDVRARGRRLLRPRRST